MSTSHDPTPEGTPPVPPTAGAGQEVGHPAAATSAAPAAAGAPSTGSPLAALMGLPLVAGRIWSGRLPDGLRLAQELPRFGWVSIAAAVVLIPFVLTFLLGRTGAGMFNVFSRGFGSYGRSYLAIDAGEFFQIFFLLLLVTAVTIILRVVALWAAFAWAGSRQSMSTCANLLAAAYAGHLLILPVVLLLALFPGDSTPGFATLVLMFLWAVAELGATIAAYVGINREGRFTSRSPFVPHVVCTVAWAVLVMVFLYMFMDSLQGMM